MYCIRYFGIITHIYYNAYRIFTLTYQVYVNIIEITYSNILYFFLGFHNLLSIIMLIIFLAISLKSLTILRKLLYFT